MAARSGNTYARVLLFMTTATLSACAQVATRSAPLPYVEVEIRQTPTQSDDYVDNTTAPARARITNANDWNDIQDTPVRLSNVSDLPGGKLLFGATPATTPTLSELALTLPRNGNWVEFSVAGVPGQTSARDKDAMVEVREVLSVTSGGSVHDDGTVLARRSLMVLPAGGTVPTSGANVEIQLRRTAVTLDDYLTWSPTVVRVKLAQPAANPVPVILTNMNTSGGQLVFGPAPPASGPIPEPTQSSVPLFLPADGTTWAEAVVAGAFGHPSVRDKDAVLDVRTPGGQLLGREGLMVRIRKNAQTLSTDERDRFLRALLRHHQLSTTNYATAQEIHTLVGGHVQGHGGPAFLPWHRAFVLRFERELQSVDPGVALPYWKSGEPAPSVFSQDFMGVSSSNPGWGLDGFASFAATNPLQFWVVTVSGTSFTGVRRRPSFAPNQAAGVTNTGVFVLTDAETIALPGNYQTWRPSMEIDPHGQAHVYAGGSNVGWIRQVSISVGDPLFFMHHANVDRQWALWQIANPIRFDTTNTAAYEPTGVRTGSSCLDIGSHLWDTMWPWNGLTTTCWPASAPGGAFPQTADALLGVPARPRPSDVLDYRRTILSGAGIGFAYDDIPHVP